MISAVQAQNLTEVTGCRRTAPSRSPDMSMCICVCVSAQVSQCSGVINTSLTTCEAWRIANRPDCRGLGGPLGLPSFVRSGGGGGLIRQLGAHNSACHKSALESIHGRQRWLIFCLCERSVKALSSAAQLQKVHVLNDCALWNGMVKFTVSIASKYTCSEQIGSWRSWEVSNLWVHWKIKQRLT